MSARTDNVTTPARVVYESPCHRVRIEREAHRKFALYLDGGFVGVYSAQYKAEAVAGIWLYEQTEELSAQLADEQADRDADEAAEPALITRQAGDLEITVDASGMGAMIWRGAVIEIEPGDLLALRLLLA